MPPLPPPDAAALGRGRPQGTPSRAGLPQSSRRRPSSLRRLRTSRYGDLVTLQPPVPPADQSRSWARAELAPVARSRCALRGRIARTFCVRRGRTAGCRITAAFRRSATRSAGATMASTKCSRTTATGRSPRSSTAPARTSKPWPSTIAARRPTPSMLKPGDSILAPPVAQLEQSYPGPVSEAEPPREPFRTRAGR